MLTFQEDHQWKGLWWIPGKARKKLPGTLIYKPAEGLSLGIDGAFFHYNDPDVLKRVEVLLGAVGDGPAITLDGCYPVTIWPRGEFTETHYRVNRAIIGAHLKEVSTAKIDSLTIFYTHMAKWYQPDNIKPRWSDGCYGIGYEKKEPVAFSLRPSGLITLGSAYSISGQYSPRIESRITQDVYVRLEGLDNPLLENHFDVLRLVGRFISFGVLEPIYPIAVRLQVDKKYLKRSSYVHPSMGIDVLYSLPGVGNPVTVKEHTNILFCYKDIEENFEEYINNWILCSGKYYPVVELFFGNLYGGYLYLEQYFLNVIRANEVFHRRRFGGKYQGDKEFEKTLKKKFIDTIPTGIEDDYTQSIKSKIEYLNEYSLRTRLKAIFKEYSPILSPYILDKKKFINDVVDTRNYLIHYDEGLANSRKTGKELYVLCRLLEFIIETCLLCEIGFCQDDIVKIFERNARFGFFLDLKVD